MKPIKRFRVKKPSVLANKKTDIIIEEPSPEQEPDWEESKGTGVKSKFCKPCLKKNSCVIGSLAMVMACDKIEFKKKRGKG